MGTESVPQTIDVTGLTPDAIRAVQTVVAAFRGRSVPAYDPAARGGPPPGETAEEWIARWDAYIESVRTRPRREGVVEIDDDRGSLYDRSTD